jgi:anti-sigma factor RsiW
MKVVSNIKCIEAEKLMSPYIDSMVEPEESERLEIHLESCEPCQRQLKSYISLRSMMAGIEQARPPKDLVLETRIRLSHARSASRLDAVRALLVNVLKPLAIPAASGVALTVLSFSVMFGYVGMNFRVQDAESAMTAMEQPVRATDQTLLSMPGNGGSEWREPVSVQANVGVNGLITGFTILGGQQSPAVRRLVTNWLYPAQFMPATLFGKPVNSTIILSIVNVRS